MSFRYRLELSECSCIALAALHVSRILTKFEALKMLNSKTLGAV